VLGDYTADTYTQINEVEDLGTWGGSAKEITFSNLSDQYMRRRAGTIDSGKIALAVGRDPLDAGQTTLRANVGNHLPFNFKVSLNDAPNAAGLPTEFYFRGVVLGAANKFGKADEITMTDFEIGIDGAILEVPAAYVITAAPAAGALPAATHAVAYTETIVATGGDGTVSYAVTLGTLPDGLALNAASGVISGTPTTAGAYSFTIAATFASGGTQANAYTLAAG
jgi:hypothetical protein